MGLVGLVLFVVLAASVVAGYQTEARRVEAAVNQAFSYGPDNGERPWVGGRNSGQALLDFLAQLLGGLTSDGSGGSGTRGSQSTQSAFTPVYVALVDRATLTILGDNSAFVIIDSSLANEALAHIERRLPQHRATQNAGAHGLLPSLKIFYRAETTGAGGMMVALADASALVDNTLRMVGSSILIWLGAMLFLFVISLLLSRIALRPASEAWERQRRFVADASHELKTPLTVILANNSLLLARPESTIAEQRQWIDSTQAEAQRMDNLVRDLLLLAQTEEGAQGTADGSVAGRGPGAAGRTHGSAGVRATRQAIDFSALVRRVLLQFEAVFFERSVSLTTDIADGVGVVGDAEQLERLVQILLDNASKYAGARVGATPGNAAGVGAVQGAAAVHVSLHPGSAHGQHALLRVANNGNPIAPEALPHLFERFYRADQAHSDAEGSGLGLSLAQAIVNAHRGNITVTSNATTGTIFTITL
jgi:signal transduction histidine kinase